MKNTKLCPKCQVGADVRPPSKNGHKKASKNEMNRFSHTITE